MRLKIVCGEAALVAEALRWLDERVWTHHAKSMYVPAGETPRPLWASVRASPPRYFSSLRLLQLDDVEGIFAQYFKRELPGMSVDPPFSDIQADLGIVGIGKNGHVAFHEPGTPAIFRHGLVPLRPETARDLGVEPGTIAYTFGIAALLKTKALLLLARGESKRSILERLLREDKALPATALLEHPDLTILTDISVTEPRY